MYERQLERSVFGIGSALPAFVQKISGIYLDIFLNEEINPEPYLAILTVINEGVMERKVMGLIHNIFWTYFN